MADPVPLYQDVRWIVTTIIALWGAGLATYEKWIKKREQKPRVEVLLYPSEGVGHGGPPIRYLAIHVKNVWQVDVVFHDNSRSLRLKTDDVRLAVYHTPINAVLPVTLKPGDAFTTHVPVADAKVFLGRAALNGVVEVSACVQDAIQREFCSNWLKYDFDR